MSGVAGGVLNGSARVDVAVVGGGIVGLATAYSVLRKSPATSLILIEKVSITTLDRGRLFFAAGVEALSSGSQINMAFAFASSANSLWPWRRANFHTCMLFTKEAWQTD
jgi:glycine/D-amino acid oxidase-like deaminating enzyme